MKLTNIPTKLLTLLLLPLCCGIFSISAFAQEAAPPAVVETWACSYEPGKSVQDVMAARDYYLKQADKAGLTLGPAYMWTLLKGDVDFDLVWLAPHANFMAFAASADAESAAPEIVDVQARFDAVIKCKPRLSTLMPMFQREGAGDSESGTNIISTNACQLTPGVGADQIDDLGKHINGVLGAMADNTPSAVYAMAAMTGGQNTPDFVLFTVNDSLTSYGNFIGAVGADPEGQMLGRHFNMMGDCNLAMWTSQQVITPAPAE
jgi:hypothetical protein